MKKRPVKVVIKKRLSPKLLVKNIIEALMTEVFGCHY